MRMSTPGAFLAYSALWGSISSCVILLVIKMGINSQAVFALKDAPIYLVSALLIGFWLNQKRNWLALALIGVFFCLLFVNYLYLNPDYPAPLNNIRQILAPLFLLLIYCGISTGMDDTENPLRFVCMVALAVFVFGIVEQALQLWPRAGLNQYFSLKGIPTNEAGVSFMFYEPAFGYRERMTSTLLDPISLGHFFATLAILVYYENDKSKLLKTTLAVCILGLLLCLSKGAILQFFVGAIVLNRRFPLLLRAPLVVLPFIATSFIDRTGIDIHLRGLYNAIDTLSPLGHGIGSSGNYAKMFGDDLTKYYQLQISDTYMGALAGQIGLVGILIWILIAAYIIRSSASSPASARIGFTLFASISLVSVLSENTMNVTSFLIPAILIALAVRRPRQAVSHQPVIRRSYA